MFTTCKSLKVVGGITREQSGTVIKVEECTKAGKKNIIQQYNLSEKNSQLVNCKKRLNLNVSRGLFTLTFSQQTTTRTADLQCSKKTFDLDPVAVSLQQSGTRAGAVAD